MLKIVYNDRYGGFGMNKAALEEYNRLSLTSWRHPNGIARDDPVLIEMVERMGNSINNENSNLTIKQFDNRYKHFLKWTEYDGKETVTIDYDKYIIYTIRQHVDSDLSDPEKIKRIKELYNENPTMGMGSA
jgi:hypothetical protein